MFTGITLALMGGYATYRAWMASVASSLGLVIVDELVETVLLAQVDFGRWIVQCPNCNGAEYAEPGVGFFCFSCGNALIDGRLYPVTFPDEADQIEKLLEERPVQPTSQQASLILNPIYRDYPRSWTPDETVDDLKRQNKEMKDKIDEGEDEDGNGI